MTINILGYQRKSIILVFNLLMIFVSCTKENLPKPPSPVDYIAGKTVRYTILVVAAGNSSFKSTNGLDSTVVSVVMNDSIYHSVTDANGMAKFNNLAAGVIAVNVKRANFTTANLIIDLTAKSDTGYDSQNLRNAATMIALFPTKGAATANISGRLFANLDLIAPGLELAPAATQVSAIIESKQLKNYVNHSGDGEILSLSYEPTVFKTLTNAGSDYSLIVPSSGSGLKIIVSANDFQFNQLISVGNSQRKVFHVTSDTIVAVSGFSYFTDLIYN